MKMNMADAKRCLLSKGCEGCKFDKKKGDCGYTAVSIAIAAMDMVRKQNKDIEAEVEEE